MDTSGLDQDFYFLLFGFFFLWAKFGQTNTKMSGLGLRNKDCEILSYDS